MAMTRALHMPVTGIPMVDSRRCFITFTPATISIPCKKNSMCRLRAAAATASSSTVDVAPVADEEQAYLTPPLKEKYFTKVVPLLQQEFKYTNKMQVPKLEKIVVNCGIGDANQNAKLLESAMKDIALITGQRPYKTRAKKSIANFKIREGVPVGISVTLRRNLMWYFLERLISLALPRTRDFEGLNPNSFDGHGNYSVGITEQSVFPEIVIESKMGGSRGMDVCITTSATRDNEAQKLLSLLGMPFRDGDVPEATY